MDEVNSCVVVCFRWVPIDVYNGRNFAPQYSTRIQFSPTEKNEMEHFNVSSLHIYIICYGPNLFFLTRIWTLCRNIYIAGLVKYLILVQFGLGLVLSVTGDFSPDFEVDPIYAYSGIVGTWVSVRAACDALIAVSMVILLRYKRTGFNLTNNAINTIVYWIICTGAVTGILSTVVMGMFVQRRFRNSAPMIGIPLGGLYPISMLANLHISPKVGNRLVTHSDGTTAASRAGDSSTPRACQKDVVVAHKQVHAVQNHPHDESCIVVTIHRTQERDDTDTNEASVDCDSELEPNDRPTSSNPESIDFGQHEV